MRDLAGGKYYQQAARRQVVECCGYRPPVSCLLSYGDQQLTHFRHRRKQPVCNDLYIASENAERGRQHESIKNAVRMVAGQDYRSALRNTSQILVRYGKLHSHVSEQTGYDVSSFPNAFVQLRELVKCEQSVERS